MKPFTLLARAAAEWEAASRRVLLEHCAEECTADILDAEPIAGMWILGENWDFSPELARSFYIVNGVRQYRPHWDYFIVAGEQV